MRYLIPATIAALKTLILASFAALLLTSCDAHRIASQAEQAAQIAAAQLEQMEVHITSLRNERDRLMVLAERYGMERVADAISATDAMLERAQEALPALREHVATAQATATAAKEQAAGGTPLWQIIVTAALSLVAGAGGAARKFAPAAHALKGIVAGIDRHRTGYSNSDQTAILLDDLRAHMTEPDKALVNEIRAHNA